MNAQIDGFGREREHRHDFEFEDKILSIVWDKCKSPIYVAKSINPDYEVRHLWDTYWLFLMEDGKYEIQDSVELEAYQFYPKMD